VQLRLLCVVTSLACSGRDGDSGSDGEGWLGPAVDLGSDMATGAGFEFSNGSHAWLAAEHIVPDVYLTMPPADIPELLWDMVQAANIADEGSCPYVTASGATVTWKSDCRSQDGYEWTGELSETQWEDESGRWKQWTMSIEVIADVENPSFSRMTLEGDFVDLTADSIEGLERAVHANLRAGVDGYWEQQSVASDREAAWADYVISGRWERGSDGRSKMAGSLDLGEYGGLRFESEAMLHQDSCTGEPKGTLALTSSQTATLDFEGADDCDRCASFSLDGAFAGQACGS
jgi:hypothetical protein